MELVWTNTNGRSKAKRISRNAAKLSRKRCHDKNKCHRKGFARNRRKLKRQRHTPRTEARFDKSVGSTSTCSSNQSSDIKHRSKLFLDRRRHRKHQQSHLPERCKVPSATSCRGTIASDRSHVPQGNRLKSSVMHVLPQRMRAALAQPWRQGVTALAKA